MAEAPLSLPADSEAIEEGLSGMLVCPVAGVDDPRTLPASANQLAT